MVGPFADPSGKGRLLPNADWLYPRSFDPSWRPTTLAWIVDANILTSDAPCHDAVASDQVGLQATLQASIRAAIHIGNEVSSFSSTHLAQADRMIVDAKWTVTAESLV
jgi:hypothetical protein